MARLQIRKSEMTKRAKAASAKKGAKRQKGHWGITAGSRKEAIARVLDAKGLAAAFTKAATLSVKEATVRSWASHWKRQGLWQPETKGSS